MVVAFESMLFVGVSNVATFVAAKFVKGLDGEVVRDVVTVVTGLESTVNRCPLDVITKDRKETQNSEFIWPSGQYVRFKGFLLEPIYNVNWMYHVYLNWLNEFTFSINFEFVNKVLLVII